MKVTLTIPDELFETYEKRGGTKEMLATLTRFADVPSTERALVVWGKDRLQLEAIMQTTMESPKRLLDALRNCGSIKIGPVERIFSPSEIARLGDQAKFHGRTEAEWLSYTAEQALDYILDRM